MGHQSRVILVGLFAVWAALAPSQSSALGACTASPPAQTCDATVLGKFGLGHCNVYYCGGSGWIDMASFDSGSSCTGNEGRLRYWGGTVQVCHASTIANWYYTNQTAAGSCTSADTGRIKFNGTAMQFCDGTSWYTF